MTAIDDMIHEYVFAKSSYENRMIEDLLKSFLGAIRNEFGFDVEKEVSLVIRKPIMRVGFKDLRYIELEIKLPGCSKIYVEYYKNGNTTFYTENSKSIVCFGIKSFPQIVMNARREYEEIKTIESMKTTTTGGSITYVPYDGSH